MLSSAHIFVADSACLLIAASGWYYLFYSRAAQKLSGVEADTSNRRRVLLRRCNGVVMMFLAMLLYFANHIVELKDRPIAATAVLLGIIGMLGISVVLGWVDLRLTMDLRSRRRDDRDKNDRQ
ncbi:MAG TPA: hypothetical protein VH370_24965 [Humisphaera sp.]|jgi:hypothetical protein|nr:hypothetical protein [Humisphaera sp.]